jgi:GTP-binding protein HflX
MLHLVDASDPDPDGRIRAVRGVLDEIHADRVPEQLVFTKADVASPDVVADLLRTHPDALAVSARTGVGIPALLETLGDRLRALASIVELQIPYDRGDVLAALHREGDVLVVVHEDAGTRVQARLSESMVGRFGALVTSVDGVPTVRR